RRKGSTLNAGSLTPCRLNRPAACPPPRPPGKAYVVARRCDIRRMWRRCPVPTLDPLLKTEVTVSPDTRSDPRSRGDSSVAVVAVAVGIALLPVLTPALPGNAAPVDFVLVLSIVVVLLWA